MNAQSGGRVVIFEPRDETAGLQTPERELASAVGHLARVGELRNLGVALLAAVLPRPFEQVLQDGRLAFAQAVLEFEFTDEVWNVRAVGKKRRRHRADGS